ncbi:MAG: hypothetical protein K9J83_05470 [Desulfarculaceae bacterium]|nr:hypothetical protein [Desulfarculaceae bacterium]
MKPIDSDYSNPPFASRAESLKDRFLASVFSKDPMETESVLSDILEFIEKHPRMTESDQKGLYQITAAMGGLKDRVPDSLSGRVADCGRRLDRFLKDLARAEIQHPASIDYPCWKSLQGLNQEMRNRFLESVVTLQLTCGCGNFCRRCNEWALPGPRKHFSRTAVLELADRLKKRNNTDFALYCASDPLDWEDGNHTIVTLMEQLRDNGSLPSYGLLTKAPKAKEALLADLVHKGFDVSVSVTAKNRTRIRRIELDYSISLSLQHDTEDLLIPARLDEDFESVKPSITDSYGTEITPDGAFIVIPAFTSALNLTGQRRIPVDGTTRFFPEKRAGRDGLRVEYFKPLPFVRADGETFISGRLLDTQVENILLDTGAEDLTPPGLSSLETFFRTFERKALEKRKQSLPSTLKRLKKTCAPDEYRRKAAAFRNFCDPELVKQARISAFSFFLESVREYAKTHPTRSTIVRHLRQKNPPLHKSGHPPENGRPLQDLLFAEKIDAFDLFTRAANQTLTHPDDERINRFIESFPSCFDTETHRYRFA